MLEMELEQGSTDGGYQNFSVTLTYDVFFSLWHLMCVIRITLQVLMTKRYNGLSNANGHIGISAILNAMVPDK